MDGGFFELYGAAYHLVSAARGVVHLHYHFAGDEVVVGEQFFGADDRAAPDARLGERLHRGVFVARQRPFAYDGDHFVGALAAGLVGGVALVAD